MKVSKLSGTVPELEPRNQILPRCRTRFAPGLPDESKEVRQHNPLRSRSPHPNAYPLLRSGFARDQGQGLC
jgi:hypothetical protein